MAPEFEGVASLEDTFFAWWNEQDISVSARECLDHLDAYIAEEGPFDGILAFSQGATVAGSFLARKMRMNPDAERAHPTFKCAIFMSSNGVYDVNDPADDSIIRLLTPEEDGEAINIPTAHIWGSNDTTVNAELTSRMSCSNTREVYIHSGGHEVPGTGMKDDVTACVKIIRRVIATAMHEEYT
jgi:pimeloyl-ACP methyl ester carboxylesterase